ncbi:uncharacterized protein [Apostichopus japonicus]|uniref:uncharacterized protein isoform X2 n=1 Tax=Stichopus japonicus TaxID=307972 RepID=UPI003AB4F5A1
MKALLILPLLIALLGQIKSVSSQDEKVVFTGIELEVVDGSLLPNQVSDVFLKLSLSIDPELSAETKEGIRKLWRAKAWSSAFRMGGGEKISFQKQVLSSEQAAEPVNNNMTSLSFEDIIYQVDLTGRECSEVGFICVRFQEWTEGPPITFILEDGQEISRMTSCAAIECTEDPCYGIYCDIPDCPEGFFVDYEGEGCCPGCEPEQIIDPCEGIYCDIPDCPEGFFVDYEGEGCCPGCEPEQIIDPCEGIYCDIPDCPEGFFVDYEGEGCCPGCEPELIIDPCEGIYCDIPNCPEGFFVDYEGEGCCPGCEPELIIDPCEGIHCSIPNCPEGFFVDYEGPGCCPGCTKEDTNECGKHEEGDMWIERDGINCMMMSCLNGEVMMAMAFCERPECEDPIYPDDSCCPVCPDTNECGKHEEGDMWIERDGINCMMMSCLNGEVMMAMAFCERPECEDPIYPDDSCCPVCPEPAEDLCSLAKESGLCLAYFPRYFFNSVSGQCEVFIYGGCGGNDNNFAKLEDCEDACVPPEPEENGERVMAPTDEPEMDKNGEPTMAPSHEPEMDKNGEPTMAPTDEPEMDKNGEPTMAPSHEPEMDKNGEPTMAPTDEPEMDKNGEPTMAPTDEPEMDKNGEPTMAPTDEPEMDKNGEPTIAPSHEPEMDKNGEPTMSPTDEPEMDKNGEPTMAPSHEPEMDKNGEPTMAPTDEPEMEANVDECDGHKDGENWEAQPCEKCTCFQGAKLCATPVCISTGPCEVDLVQEGACCSYCPVPIVRKDPEDECDGHDDGDSWEPQSCETCTCFAGSKICASPDCAPPQCENPVQGEGACCPSCPDTDKQTCLLPIVVGPCRAAVVRYAFNAESKECERFLYGGCKGNENNFMSLESCQETCELETVAETNCPEVCILLYDPVCANDGSTFSNECEFMKAKCKNADLEIAGKGRCEDVIVTDQCEGHSDGESWEPQPCEYCYCADGIKTCAMPSCEPLLCAVELEEGEGVCCPICPEPLVAELNCPEVCISLYDPVCANDGSTFSNECEFMKAKCKNADLEIAGKGRCEDVIVTDQCEGHSDGESWEPQPCEYCYCADGIKACAMPSCAMPPCAVELEEGEGVCCPTCPEPLVPLTACGNYSDGDEWSPDPCSRCICNEGVSECNLVVCPELGCISPKSVEGECCQQCLAPLRARLVNLRASATPRIWRGDKKLRPRFNFEVRPFRTSENVTGTGLWKMSFWLDSSVDGDGDKMFYNEQVLSDEQASQPLYSSENLVFSDVRIPIGGPGVSCPEDDHYYCFQFLKGDKPSVRFFLQTPRQEPDVMRCIRAPCV